MTDIKIKLKESSNINNTDWNNLRFGVYFSDHVFMSDYKGGKWDDDRIIPYGPMEVEPGMCTLHYGQTIFEGLKAFPDINGGVNLFRPDKNAARLNHSGAMVCIPAFDENLFVDAIKELVKIDKNWIPQKRGESLYLRPVVYGSSNFLGVHASEEYKLIIMTSPVGSYYAEGLNPVDILVSDEYVRAVKGGLGSAKTAANYAASMLGGAKAKELGYAQVLWLDGVSRSFIDEVGAMNIMFHIGDELITPSLDRGAILNGVTRDTVLTLAKDWGMKITERDITIDEILKANADGSLKEVFGTGTAAVISPVGKLTYKGKDVVVNGGKIGELAQKMYDTITGLQYGEIEDTHGWIQHFEV